MGDPPVKGSSVSAPRAVWLTPELIALPTAALSFSGALPDLTWHLCTSPDGGIDLSRFVAGPNTTALGFSDEGLPAGLRDRFPHLASAVALRVPAGLDLASVIQGQVVLFVRANTLGVSWSTPVQLAPLIDMLHPGAAALSLGPVWDGPVVTLRVWAPTARSVELLLWVSGRAVTDPPQRMTMVREQQGTWSIDGDLTWLEGRYQFAATVYAPVIDQVVENVVTDPYAIALTTNSTHAVLADLADPALRPSQWEAAATPCLQHPVDQTIYELHVRDFSWVDDRVPPAQRGTYAAFTVDGWGSEHLERLADSGLTSVQLLPIFDYASAEEDRELQNHPDVDRLRRLDGDSPRQQELTQTPHPPHNWGYDPWHYFAPEGSLATRASTDGAARTREVRAMIGALHARGLRVILDQVFNHTSGHGQEPTSVLDRLVPGYYYRHNLDGSVATSTCCPTVATETMMAGKLMLDAVVFWAREYRVDGFRFDLMGHHSRDTMLAVRSALDALTLADDGVDGRAITLHGEGWNFGEVADNARFVQASQGNLEGTGIATFSDRLRDAVRGGAPFDDDPRVQGFGSGLVAAPNGAVVNGDGGARAAHLLQFADLIQLGLAGTLGDFTFRSQYTREQVRGDHLNFRGAPAGFATQPGEAMSYVDAHDNETLYDALVLKLPPSISMADRVRINTVCLALATLGQSPVLWHAGSDLLRSKSLDRNSHASGDWFNELDFSLRRSVFPRGLPQARDNGARWPLLAPLLADPGLVPTASEAARAHRAACDLLRIRASTRLFRLGDADQIRAKVSFPISGTWAQQPGVIIMMVDDRAGRAVDERWSGVVVAVNANAWPVRQDVTRLRKGRWVLHPVQAAGDDQVVATARCDDGLVVLPPWTCAVFVDQRPTPLGPDEDTRVTGDVSHLGAR